jgi:hypothetical protein
MAAHGMKSRPTSLSHRWHQVFAWVAIATVLLLGIRVHGLKVGSAANHVVTAANTHLPTQTLRSFALSYFHPTRPFRIALAVSDAPHVTAPADPFVCAHQGGFYVNRPPPIS